MVAALAQNTKLSVMIFTATKEKSEMCLLFKALSRGLMKLIVFPLTHALSGQTVTECFFIQHKMGRVHFLALMWEG